MRPHLVLMGTICNSVLKKINKADILGLERTTECFCSSRIQDEWIYIGHEGEVLMMEVVPLSEKTRESLLSLLPFLSCEVTVRRWPSASQPGRELSLQSDHAGTVILELLSLPSCEK